MQKTQIIFNISKWIALFHNQVPYFLFPFDVPLSRVLNLTNFEEF